MNQRTTFIAVSIMFAITAVTLIACNDDASPRAKDAKVWLDKFYTRYTIRGQWGFFGAEAKDKNVVLEINVPEQQAQDLMKFDELKRKGFIAHNACPPIGEEVWSILDPDGDIVVHTRLNGNRFAEVSCKNPMQGI
jgi:hypothetical protein